MRAARRFGTTSTLFFGLALVSGCGDPAGATPDLGGCSRGAIEPDFGSMPLRGPGLDPATARLRPPPAGRFLVSSTYLAMPTTAAARARFGELMAPIGERLAGQRGLLAYSLGASDRCYTARTLTVWESEEAMLDFVVSPAHSTAMAAVSEVSRGQSLVDHWEERDADQITWASVAQHLAGSTRRLY